MAQRILKAVYVANDPPNMKYAVTYYIEGTDGDPGGVYSDTEVDIGAIDTPTKVGDLLVVAFPEIDLPTT